MKLTTINVQITKTPKQYEAVRIGAEAELQDGENMRNAIKALRNELEDVYAEMYPPKQAAQPAAAAAESKKDEPKKRESLKFEDPRVKQAVARMEQNPEKKKLLNQISAKKQHTEELLTYYRKQKQYLRKNRLGKFRNGKK